MALYSNTYGQVDPKKIDSLSRSIDSSVRAYKLQQDSIIRDQDSAYKSGLNKVLQQRPVSLDNFSAEQKRREAQDRERVPLRIVISVVLFIVGVVALLQTKNTKS